MAYPNVTARILPHAAARCAEMKISTKIAKQIIRNADIIRPAYYDGEYAACSDQHPNYVVFYREADDGVPEVLTVVFRTYEHYDRDGHTWTPSKEPRKR